MMPRKNESTSDRSTCSFSVIVSMKSKKALRDLELWQTGFFFCMPFWSTMQMLMRFMRTAWLSVAQAVRFDLA